MKRALIGRGGHARECVSIIPYPIELYTDEEFCKIDYNNYEVIIAVGSSKLRREIFDKLPKDTKYFTYIHPTTLIGKNVQIGMGSFIGPYCVMTTDISIGEHSLLLRANQVGHDSISGRFLSMMGGAIINGNCILGDEVYLGTNSSVKEKLSVCDNVTLGMNACVVKNIVQPGTYVGVPCYKVK